LLAQTCPAKGKHSRARQCLQPLLWQQQPQFRHYPQLRCITGAGWGLPVHTPFSPAHPTADTPGELCTLRAQCLQEQSHPLKFLPCLYISFQLPLAQLPAGACSNWTATCMFVICIPFRRALLNPVSAPWPGLPLSKQQRTRASPLKAAYCETTAAG